MSHAADPVVSRLLVIDDNQAIHQDFRKIFGASHDRSVPSAAEIALFGGAETAIEPEFQIDSASQGQEGLALVQLAWEFGNPYSVAFVDVRMPPGWDGIETTARIWKIDRDIQIVICTAYSDYSWGEMLAKLGRSDRLVILKKPFDTIEVVQLASALTEKWRLARHSRVQFQDLEKRVDDRTRELLQAGERFKSAAAQYRLLFDSNPHPMWVYDLESLRFVAVNQKAIDDYGYSREQFLSMTIRDIRPPEDQPLLQLEVDALADQGSCFSVWRHRKRDGTLIDVEISADGILFDGRAARLVLAHDVTARVEQDRKIARLNRIRAIIGGISSAMLRLRERDALLQEACRVAATAGVFPMAWVASLDPQTGALKVAAFHASNPQAIETIKRALLEGEPARTHPSYRAARCARTVVVADLADEPALQSEQSHLLAHGYRSCAALPLFVEGHVVAVLVLLAAEVGFFDEQEIALLEWLTTDLSFALELMRKSERLDHLANYDSLTGLANAQLFHDRLSLLVNVARPDHSKICVVTVDLERFTQINDLAGRSVGDEVLRQVGERFGQALIEPYALGRIGADTFAVASTRDQEVIATRLRDRIFSALKQPFAIGGHEILITAQMGIALFPEDGEDSSSLFKNAEAALKLAKSTGSRFAYFSNEMNERIERRLAFEQQLHEAIDKRQFVLHYQPRIDLISGELVGAEALIRWQHPRRGLLAPAEFIAFAEESGLIVPIGGWVLDTVCAQQSAWIASGIRAVPVAVNLSSVQFEKGDLLHSVQTALTDHALDPRMLYLELTESAVMNDPVAAAKSLRALRELGVRLALDDFGTAYSSLAHLKRFPFDSVKIDGSFIADITNNSDDAAIATAIIAMAHQLKLKVVAECVETQGQLNYLRAQGCDEMQGNFFSAAISAVEFEAQLRGHHRLQLPAAAPDDQQTVLLVDDEPSIRTALSRVLRRDGYRILSAAGGQEGLDILAENQVEVIISDQRMPAMSGTVFLSTVKDLYPDTMRIILSGYTDLEVVTDAVNRGAVFKFLTKPWDDEQLREQVRDAFRRYRLRRKAS